MHRDVGYAGEESFTAHVFGENSIELGVVDAPDRWDVTVSPAIVDMPPEDYTYMELGGEYRKIAPITVDVDIPSDPEDGQHQIRVRVAETGTSKDASQVAVTESQLLTFTVNVVPPPPGSDDALEMPDDSLLPASEGPFRGSLGRGRQNTAETDSGSDDTGDSGDGRDADSRGDGGDRDRTRTEQDDQTQSDDADETVQGRQGENDEQEAAGITGLVLRHVPDTATAVNVFVFLLVWSVVGYVVMRRRNGDASTEDETPWDV